MGRVCQLSADEPFPSPGAELDRGAEILAAAAPPRLTRAVAPSTFRGENRRSLGKSQSTTRPHNGRLTACSAIRVWHIATLRSSCAQRVAAAADARPRAPDAAPAVSSEMALVYLPAASEYLLRNVMSIRTGIANTQVNLSQ
eukprot:COSAG01_NODE_27550_length_682_cov_668.703259_1_plen_141_part_10